MQQVWSAPIVVLEEVDSTNSEAMRRALAGETGPLWIRANAQLQGRGRSGRSWESPRGNLYATLLFQPHCEPAAVPQLSLLTAVAVYDALRATRALPGLRLKWPNDVLIGLAKVAGILPESIIGQHGNPLVCLGIGINLVSFPQISSRAATSLVAQQLDLSPEMILERLDASIAREIARWNRGAGFAAIRSAWLERAGPVGEALRVNAGEGEVDGRYLGLDADGSLLLSDLNGRERRFSFGDVALLSATTAKAR